MSAFPRFAGQIDSVTISGTIAFFGGDIVGRDKITGIPLRPTGVSAGK